MGGQKVDEKIHRLLPRLMMMNFFFLIDCFPCCFFAGMVKKSAWTFHAGLQ